MIKNIFYAIASCIFLLGCDSVQDSEQNVAETSSSSSIEEAAIVAGILPDPDNIKLEGHFETRNDIGTDKFCAIKDGDNDYKVGILAVFGSDSRCEGRGVAQLDGANVNIQLNETTKANKKDNATCEFTATYDGISIQIPGNIPESCSQFCNNRASLSGTGYFLTQEGNGPARKSRGKELKSLCRG